MKSCTTHTYYRVQKTAGITLDTALISLIDYSNIIKEECVLLGSIDPGKSFITSSFEHGLKHTRESWP